LASGNRIQVGRISGLFGVKGWVRVYSYTQPRDNIIRYTPWSVMLPEGWRTLVLGEGRRHGKGVVARLEGVDDREAAAALLGAEVAIHRDQLRPLGQGEFYWSDLIGLRVVNHRGEGMGVVVDLLETGAHDVLVVQGERERLIPFVQGQVVTAVEPQAGTIRVDWELDY
jgi:16S rRNA processing protein RimM